jgi:hypothetical protein
MSKPTILRHPQPQTAVAGSTVTFDVMADGPGLVYQWRRDGTDIPHATGPSYALTALAEDDGATFSVLLRNSDGKAMSDKARLTVVNEPERVFDPRFATRSAFALAAAFVLLFWPLWIFAGRIVARDDVAAHAAVLIAAILAICGGFALLLAVFIELLEFRARTKALEQLRPAPRGGTLGPTGDVIKNLPAILKAFGQLRATSAMMVLAALLFVSAALIAWRTLP